MSYLRPCSAGRFFFVSTQRRSRESSFMKHRLLPLLAMVAALCAAAFASELPSAWRAWRYSRAIDSQHAGTLSYITLDRQVFVHSENRLHNLRDIADLGP